MIEAAIFDIGGVLAYDVWEHLLLNDMNHENPGIGALYGLPMDRVKQIGNELWAQYDRRKPTVEFTWEHYEQDYWKRFIDAFKSDLPPNTTVDTFIDMTDNFIRDVNQQHMIPILERLQSQNVTLAICSNNTEFWFTRQARKLNLKQFFAEDKTFLSCRVGYTKKDREMFEAVVKGLDADGSKCIFVDDRVSNIQRAYEWFNMTGVLFPAENAWGVDYLDALLNQMGI